MTAEAQAGGRLARARQLLHDHAFANPVAVREFRRLLRGRSAPYFVVGYLLLLGGLAALVHAGVGDIWVLDLSRLRQELAAQGYTAVPQTGLLLFTVIVIAQGYALWLLLVAALAPSFPRENELHTRDELRATLLTPGQLLSGRLCLALALTLLLLALGTPFLAVTFITGGLAPAQLGLALLVLLACAAFCAAVALMAGVETRNTTQAMLYAFLFTFIFLSFIILTPRLWASSLLAMQAEIVLIILSIYLPAALLLFALARERLADWEDRGRGFRLLLVVISCGIPALTFALQNMSGVFNLSDLRSSFVTSLVLHLGAVLLFCGRPPAPEQVRLPFRDALRQALSPRTLLRENPLGLPFFLLLLQCLSAIVHAGLAAAMGWPDTVPYFIAVTVAQAVVMLAYGGVMQLLGISLRRPGYFGVVVLVVFLLQIVIIFVYGATLTWANGRQSWLSPVLFIAEHSDWDALLDHFGVFALLLLSHLSAAAVAWSGLHQTWERQRYLGTYALRADNVRD